MAVFLLFSQLTLRRLYRGFSLLLLLLSLTAAGSVLGSCFRCFDRQNSIMVIAVTQINTFLAGNTNARIDCDHEGKQITNLTQITVKDDGSGIHNAFTAAVFPRILREPG